MLVTFLCAGMTAKAQDSLKTIPLNEVVVTGTRFETTKEKSGKMIFKLTADEIQRSGASTIPEVLNRVPGIQMDGNFGTPGTNIDYFVRGAASKRTLILIDGVPFNDPSGIDLNYDLRLVNLSNVQSIEVLRGGLSSLYGSGAASAVINITTKKHDENELQGSVSLEAGSFNMAGGAISVNGKSDRVIYGFSGRYQSTDGFSSASGADFDKDGMISENASLNLGYEFSPALSMEVYGSFDQFENEFDQGAFADDLTSGSSYFQKRVGTRFSYKSDQTKITGSYFNNLLKREFIYGTFPDDYDGSNQQINLQLNQKIGSSLQVLAGLDAQLLDYDQPFTDRLSFKSQAPFLSLVAEVENLNIQAGLRLNNHSEYGTKAVYNLNPGYVLDLGSKTLKFLTNYSTSYITPSLYQMAGPFGNENLNPELSESWDLGASVYDQNLEINAVYFQRKDTDPIDFEAFFDESFNFIGGQYFNDSGLSWVEGIEIDGQTNVDNLALRGSFTWLNNVKGDLRQRVPRIKYSLGSSFNYSDDGTVSLDYIWTGKRRQNDPMTFTEVTTGSFGLLDLALNHRFGRFGVNATVKNLLDENYISTIGFNSMGRNYRLSVSMNLGE